jgi:hypothetical protein
MQEMIVTLIADRLEWYYGEINVCRPKAARCLNVLYGDSQSGPQKNRAAAVEGSSDIYC